MRIVLFCHSLVSDWNHGNAHFLRGIVAELQARGVEVKVFEPEGGWSLEHLVADAGAQAVAEFRRAFPGLRSDTYTADTLDLDAALDGADLVIAHEWNDTDLLVRLARHRRQGGRFVLLFHDTHHRGVSDPESIARLPLDDFDGVLAFGAALRDQYRRRGWARQVWVWHEAADTRVFRPQGSPEAGDLVWIGNWGDEERTAELHEFLLRPVRELGLRATVHGVRYPEHAVGALAASGIRYGGWVANHQVPMVFASHRVTVHVPRGPYATLLPGIPTIRPFEALACGIPLISSPWQDTESLFRVGTDFLMVSSGDAMVRALRDVLHDDGLATSLACHGRETILARHTCGHRVSELFRELEQRWPGVTGAHRVSEEFPQSAGGRGSGYTPGGWPASTCGAPISDPNGVPPRPGDGFAPPSPSEVSS